MTTSDPAFVGLRFEEALDRLETLVGELESGELPLDETIQKFEEGQKLLRACTELLTSAELRVKEILRKAGDTLEEDDFDPGQDSDEEE